MKIAVLFASHRIGGKNAEIKTALISQKLNHELEFIHLAEKHIAPTLTNEAEDDFIDILNTLIKSDILLFIVPTYCPYPARFVAFMERLLDVSYQVEDKPILGKPVGIFYYCSNKICDEKYLKLLFQKYLMNDYGFYDITYDKFINDENNPNEKYSSDIIKYILDVVRNIETEVA